ncbi:MAG: AarF/UbiB family protein [Candidatus Omnitrophica bacterium]|nr:AarF/UbiB family protein [Candidatus Omnitrophota bacterium]
MRIFDFRHKYRLITRVRITVGILLRHGLGYFVDKVFKDPYLKLARWKKIPLSRNLKELSLPERLRIALEQLGPTYIKVGQFFSTRQDILPEEYIKELSKLQDSVPPFAFYNVEKIIKEDMSGPVNKFFPEFSPEPFFSASIAQVHKAKNISGKNCVVKVQRVGIEEIINQDIEVINEFGKLAMRHLPELKNLYLSDIIDEFGEGLRRQLDFIYEAGMMTKMKDFYGKSKIVVPEVYWGFTTKRVITMEKLSGIKITDIKEKNITLPKTLVKAFFKVLFETGYFHGDLHPGNILQLDDGRIGLVDFGLTGYLSFDKRRDLALIISGTLKGDFGSTIPNLKRFFGIFQSEPENFEKEVNFFIDKYSSLPIHKINLENVVKDLLKIGRKFKMRLYPEIGLLVKSIANLESICSYFNPDLNLLEISHEYWKPLMRKGIIQKFWLHEIKTVANSYVDLIKDFPVEYENFLRQNDVRIKEEQKLIEKLDIYHKNIESAGNRIAAGLISMPIIALILFLGYKELTGINFIFFLGGLFIIFLLWARIIFLL